MYQITTDELNAALEKMRPGQIDRFLKENKKYMANGKKAFCYYFKDVLAEKKIKLKDVYSFADLSESYGSKLINMEKHTKNRDEILRLCIAGHFTWIETDRALKLYGMNELYAKDVRDACIIVAINNRIYSLSEIDDMLLAKGLLKLSKEKK